MSFKKAGISKCLSLRPVRLGFKMFLPMLSLCFKMSFQNKKQQKGLSSYTLSAERTQHAIGKNYTTKTIPARKILEGNVLDH